MTTPTTVNVQFQLRADTAANWTAANPILLVNEFALETDTKKLKVGNGSSAWNSLAYFPSIVSGGTVLGNLEIGSTGTLTFEGSTADGFETTLAVTNPTADRTITLPNQSGTVVVSGNASIVDADIAAGAEIAVSKLANGTANQVIVTDGTNVSWSDDLTLAGNLTVNGTTTTINTETLVVEDKNIELGVVDTPTDVTADGGGITLKGTTDKTINWVDATDSWTSSEHIELASGKSYRINGAEVLSATTLGSGVTSSSLTSVGTLGSVTVTGDATAGTFIPTSNTAPTNGLYLPGTNSVALSTNGTGQVFITSNGNAGIGTLNASNVAGKLHLRADGDEYKSLLVLQNRNTGGNAGGAINFVNGGVDLSDDRYSYIRGIVTGAGQNGNHLVFGTNASGQASSERLRITSAGLVGIGTTTPGRKLAVSADAGVDTAIQAFTSTSGSYVQFTDSTSSSYIGTNSGSIVFLNPTTERARIDSSGRLLVGTSTSLAIGSPTNAQIQQANTSSTPNLALVNFVDASAGSYLILGASRGTSIGSYAAVVNNDRIASIRFAAADGTDLQSFAGSIECYAEADAASNDTPGRLVFSTTAAGASSPTERMRIYADGQTRCFSSATSTFRAHSAQTASATSTLFVGLHSATGVTNGTTSFAVFTNGDAKNTTGVFTSFTSDERFKQDIVEIGSQWDDIKGISLKKFRYKNDPAGELQLGVIAQELQQVCPGLVTTRTATEEDVDASGGLVAEGDEVLGWKMSILPLKAVKALQEAMERIETLEAKVAALESA